jgi:NAD(P) transhydrogenase
VKGSVAGIDPSYFLKLVFGAADGRILGVHLFGEGASELIHFGAGLVQQGATAFDLMNHIFAAVTLHEVYRSAATGAIEALAARGGECRPMRWSCVRGCHGG